MITKSGLKYDQPIPPDSSTCHELKMECLATFDQISLESQWWYIILPYYQ